MANVNRTASTAQDILDYLKTVARTELELTPSQVTGIRPETVIVDGLQLDSLKQVDLARQLEDTFEFELTLEDRQELPAMSDGRRTLSGSFRSRVADRSIS